MMEEEVDDAPSTPSGGGGGGAGGAGGGGGDVVAERTQTRSQTKKSTNLGAELEKLTLESTPPTKAESKGAKATTTTPTPTRPNSAKTRSHRIMFQKSELEDGRPKSAVVQTRTRRRKDDSSAPSFAPPSAPSSAASSAASSAPAQAPSPSHFPVRDQAQSSSLQQQQSASPILPASSSTTNKRRPRAHNNNNDAPALLQNPRGNFKQRWGKPFKGRRRSSGVGKADENAGAPSTNNNKNDDDDPVAASSASVPNGPSTLPNDARGTNSDVVLRRRQRRRRRRSTKSSESSEQQKKGAAAASSYVVGGLDDILRPSVDALELSAPTGLIYDERMSKHRDESGDYNVECPERTAAIYDKFCEYGLVARCHVVAEARLATNDEIAAFHDRVLVEKMTRLLPSSSRENDGEDEEEKRKKVATELRETHDGVYFNDATWEAAHLAAGGCIDAVEKVVQGVWKNAFALVRPPGHHAMESDFCGFCYFNNAVLAAKHAVDNLGIQRVVVVDWDVHHGNGTQDAFYRDPRVLYFSIHRYEYGAAWPHLRESDYDFIGEDKGAGYNVNVPLNEAGCGDVDYLYIFFQILLPLLTEFRPELIIVSAGYDAAIGDPLGEMRLTPSCYAAMTQYLSAFAGGRIVVALEGGYFLPSLAESAAATLKTLLGDACPRPQIHSSKPEAVVVDVVHNLKCVLGRYWQCFSPVRLRASSSSYQRRRRSSSSDLTTASILSSKPLRRSQKHHLVQFKSYRVNRPRCYSPDRYEKQSEEEIQSFQELLSASLTRHRRGRGSLSSRGRSAASTRVSGTSIVYDSAMKRHRNVVDPSHPEKPDRISAIYSELGRFGLLKHLHHVDSRLATEMELTLCHARSHVNEMRATKTTSGRDLYKLQSSFNSVYLNGSSYDCARLSCGCLLNVVDDVVNERRRNGMAIIRPPGHHAESHAACGFCLFNNVAVASRYAQVKFGERCKKVLIVDWDVHHGNGTQHIFEDDPSVLYVSLHRHDEGAFFPGTDDGDVDKIGVGRGAGFNLNVPWNTSNGRRSIGDGAYLTAFFEAVLPVATQFDPDLVLVSAGFDAAAGDPLGKCHVTPMAYATMTKYLSVLAEGRVILALEGGYNLKSIAECMAACGAALLGCPLPLLDDAAFRKPLHHHDRESIGRVKEELRPFWPLLDARVVAEEEEEEEMVDKEGIDVGDEDGDLEEAGGSVDLNRNLRLKSESDGLADVFEAMSIHGEAATSAAAARSPAPSSSARRSTTTPTTPRLDPDLKIKMAEFDLKLAHVPAVVAPEVQEEAKHLIRVLVLGQEGAKVYEEALDGGGVADGSILGVLGVAPTVPIVGASPISLTDSPLPASSTSSTPSLEESPVPSALLRGETTLEDSGILEPLIEDSEMKMEDA